MSERAVARNILSILPRRSARRYGQRSPLLQDVDAGMSSHGRPGSNNMAPTSWKALTSARLTSIKDYVAHKPTRGTRDGSRQTWDQWARQAIRKPYGSADAQRVTSAMERVQLFPGWAVRRYKDPSRVNEPGEIEY